MHLLLWWNVEASQRCQGGKSRRVAMEGAIDVLLSLVAGVNVPVGALFSRLFFYSSGLAPLFFSLKTSFCHHLVASKSQKGEKQKNEQRKERKRKEIVCGFSSSSLLFTFQCASTWTWSSNLKVKRRRKRGKKADMETKALSFLFCSSDLFLLVAFLSLVSQTRSRQLPYVVIPSCSNALLHRHCILLRLILKSFVVPVRHHLFYL